MTQKAVYAILLAILLPLISFLIIRYYSEDALEMPRHFLPDSVRTQLNNGKEVNDTLWHQIQNFKLTNQLGESVSLDTYKDKILIANFFFTHCPTICPPLTRNMKQVQESIHNTNRVGDRTYKELQFLSFSIDPERDSVPELKKWADRFQINPEQWDLLTGDKKTIYNLALEDMKLAVVDGKGVDTGFLHSDRFVLIDRARNIRGYYRGLDSASLVQLTRDIVLLTLEKDTSKKNTLGEKAKLLGFIFLLAAVAFGLFLIIFKKKEHVSPTMEKK